MRVYQVAQKLAIDSRIVVRWCRELHMAVGSPLARLTPDETEVVLALGRRNRETS